MITSINKFRKIYENLRLIPGLRLADQNVKFKDYKNINYNDIKLTELSDDGYSIMHIGVILPGDTEPNDGVILDIQIINDELYHPHRSVAKSLQGQGIGYKMTVKFIHEFGHIYTSEGRTLNKLEIPKIAAKLATEQDIEHFKTNSDGDLWILKNNPDYDYLVNKYTNNQ